MPVAATHPAWGDPAAAAPHLPPLLGELRVDVCVVGLGASGLHAVLALLDAGATVAGLEAGPGPGAGAAGRNGGFLISGMARFHHDAVAAWGRERAAALHAQTEAEVAREAAWLGVPVVGIERRAHDAAEAEDCAAHLAALRADGFAAEALPGGRPGLLLPGDTGFDPLVRCRRLAGEALRRGAHLHAASPATAIAGDGVRTPEGAVACGAVVVAVDGGLEELLPELRGRVRTARLQMLATAPARAGLVPRPVYARSGFDFWQQRPDGRVLLGGARDGHAEDEWGAPAQPTAALQAQLDATLAAQVAPGLEVTHRWAGRVGFTGDALPVCGPIRPGVVAAGGYNGHGNVVGALCGRAAAELALERRSAWAELLSG